MLTCPTNRGGVNTVIEQYTKNVRFCIICNYVNKIIPAIQSRCTRFRFNPLELDQVEDRLAHVIESEGYVPIPFLPCLLLALD